MRVIGYVRVSTNKQETSPEVQTMDLEMEAQLRGWDLEIRREEAASAKSMTGRPVLLQALADLRAHHADMLAVSKLDRLSRSVADFSRILDDSEREGWHVACLDLNVDTSSDMGRAMAHMAATFAELERRRISKRTRETMAKLKAEGRQLGRPSKLDPTIAALAADLRRKEWTLQEIAEYFNAKGYPTPTGTGRWWPAAVKRAALAALPAL